MKTVETVLLVLMLGAVTGIAARYVRAVPLPLIQIMLGALVAWPQKGLHITFDPDLFLLLFIPPLLFADGWRIPKREFFALARPILRLALGLVLFTVIGLGYLIHWMIPEMPLSVAFALAAVVSPTDAVAVSAITRNLGMPTQAMHVLEGESLLNDASGLTALKFAVLATVTGVFSWNDAARDFVWMAVGGLGAGALLGWLFSFVREVVSRRVGDLAATQMVLLLVLLPFAAYLVGEKIGVSGILAAVAAGVTTNFADLNRSTYIAERIQTEGTWMMVESAFNGAIFLLLGLQLPSILGAALVQAGDGAWLLIAHALAISLALLGMRWLWLTLGVHRSFLLAHRKGKLFDRPSHLLNLATTLAGIRGAVTLAAALSLPLHLRSGAPFPARDLVIFLATSVILVTLVIGAIGLPWVLRRLPPSGEPESVREERRARQTACEAAITCMALSEQESQRHDGKWLAQYQEVSAHIMQDYRNRIDLLEDQAQAQADAHDDEAAGDAAAANARERKLRHVLELQTRLHCIHAERDAIYRERHLHHINDASLRSLVQELDMAEIALSKRLDVSLASAGLPPRERGPHLS